MKMDYIDNLMSKETKPLTHERFITLIHNMDLDTLANRLLSGRADEEEKRKAPAVMWQASYEGNVRQSNCAIPNGLFALDVDNLKEEPDEVWRERIEKRVEELEIVLCHKSIGGHGLHIVALCQENFCTIAENQAWLASQLELPYDEKCKDWARCWILVPHRYIYYLNPEIFDDWKDCTNH